MSVLVNQGQPAVLEAAFVDFANDAVDPDSGSITLVLKDPDGATVLTIAQAGLTRVSVGLYRYTWLTAADQALGDYQAIWSALLDGEEMATDAEDVIVLPSGTPSGVTATSLAQVRALVATKLSDDDLGEVIGREESLLAAEVGALTGSRTETFTITDQTYGIPIRLRRPATTVSVTEDNVATTDVRLGADARTVQRLTATGWSAGAWTGAVEVTYTPNDAARITSWVIELVRARLAESAYDSETDGTYSYSRGDRSHDQVMAAALADIVGRTRGGRAIHSVRVSTSATPAAWIGTARP